MNLVAWDNAVNRERAELVFENRNKEYGAYQIRRNYERRVIKALLYTIGVFLVAIAVPIIMNLISNAASSKKNVMREEVTLAEPPPIDKTQPPPPPVIP